MDANTLTKRIGDFTERPTATADACARAIKAERLEEVICGRDEKGKPATFRAYFEGVFGKKLGDKS